MVEGRYAFQAWNKTMRVKVKYKPLPQQRKFHIDPSLYRLFRGGVGSGKTYAGGYESVRLAVINLGCDGMIVAPTWGILNRTTLRTFLSLLPKELIESRSKSERYIELVGGGRVYYASADRPETLEGANLAWVWLDEGRFVKKDVWPILIARIRDPKATRHAAIVTSTPHRGWLMDLWTSGNPDYSDIVASTSTNTYLPDSYYESLKRTYSAKLFSQYVEGGWGSGGGSAFMEFDTRVHVVKNLLPPAGSIIKVAVDFGIVHSAAVFFQYVPRCHTHGAEHCIHVFDELLLDDTPTNVLVVKIKERLDALGWFADEVIVDPAGNARSGYNGERETDLFGKVGLNCVWQRDQHLRDRQLTTSHIRGKLAPIKGNPSIYIDERLSDNDRGLINALANIELEEKTEVYKKDGTYDHVLDAFRYGVVWVNPPVTTGMVVF